MSTVAAIHEGGEWSECLLHCSLPHNPSCYFLLLPMRASSVHTLYLHPLFTHHHLCYVNDCYVYDLTFVFL